MVTIWDNIADAQGHAHMSQLKKSQKVAIESVAAASLKTDALLGLNWVQFWLILRPKQISVWLILGCGTTWDILMS